MVEVMQMTTAALALVAATGSLLLVLTRFSVLRFSLAQSVARWVVARRTAFTFAVAGVATTGSLYFSEVADYIPCRLCWFQRIAMYPIAAVALVGLIRRDIGARWYALALAVPGAAVAGYHSMIEQGWLSDSESCSLFGPSCADVWFESFGFMTLALMALAGFVSVVVLNTISFEPDDRPTQEFT